MNRAAEYDIENIEKQQGVANCEHDLTTMRFIDHGSQGAGVAASTKVLDRIGPLIALNLAGRSRQQTIRLEVDFPPKDNVISIPVHQNR